MAGVLLQRFIRKNIKICGDISGRISKSAEIYPEEYQILRRFIKMRLIYFRKKGISFFFTAVFEGQTRSSQLFFRDFPLSRQ